MLWRSSLDIVQTCVRNALAVATRERFRSLAIPLIGAGTGGLNGGLVSEIILEEIARSSFAGRAIVVSFPTAG